MKLRRPSYFRTAIRVWLSFFTGQSAVIIAVLVSGAETSQVFWLTQAGLFVGFAVTTIIFAKILYRQSKELYDTFKALEGHKNIPNYFDKVG